MTRVCMAVISDMTYDARVWREATALQQAGFEVTVVSTWGGQGVRQYRQDGVEILAVPFAIDTPLALPGFYRRFGQVLAGRPADIYHAHNVNCLPVCHRLARRRRVPLVYDSHELFTGLVPAPPRSLGRVKQTLEKWIERRLIGSANRVITVNDSYARILAELYCIAPPAVLRNVPPLVPWQPSTVLRDRLGLSAERTIVLYQGGYYLDTRALDNLIVAMAEVPEQAVLVLIGFGLRGEAAQLERLSAQLGLSDRVRFLPPVPHQELLPLTMGADIGTIPFLDNAPAMHWCTPNKIYEYLMAGLPVAASNLPELGRIVADHDVGAVFDPQRPDSMAAALRELLADPARLAAMKHRARQVAEAHYHWDAESSKLVDLYHDLAGGRG